MQLFCAAALTAAAAKRRKNKRKKKIQVIQVLQVVKTARMIKKMINLKINNKMQTRKSECNHKLYFCIIYI